jgi:hypothetical protein
MGVRRLVACISKKMKTRKIWHIRKRVPYFQNSLTGVLVAYKTILQFKLSLYLRNLIIINFFNNDLCS